MDLQELGMSIARQEEQIKGLAVRMDNLEKLTESVNKLAISVERLTSKQSATEENVATLTNEVAEIRDKPAKRWETAVAAVIAALIGAAATYFLK